MERIGTTSLTLTIKIIFLLPAQQIICCKMLRIVEVSGSYGAAHDASWLLHDDMDSSRTHLEERASYLLGRGPFLTTQTIYKAWITHDFQS